MCEVRFWPEIYHYYASTQFSFVYTFLSKTQQAEQGQPAKLSQRAAVLFQNLEWKIKYFKNFKWLLIITIPATF